MVCRRLMGEIVKNGTIKYSFVRKEGKNSSIKVA